MKSSQVSDQEYKNCFYFVNGKQVLDYKKLFKIVSKSFNYEDFLPNSSYLMKISNTLSLYPLYKQIKIHKKYAGKYEKFLNDVKSKLSEIKNRNDNEKDFIELIELILCMLKEKFNKLRNNYSEEYNYYNLTNIFQNLINKIYGIIQKMVYKRN